ncbi:helix-turn-helix domain-containing protein [Paenibacillus flagellatus]|uniref:HTH araC/xylS-type domain-containing protein n=1 Tax=Paenibacillus flagellatus TaxID=2211139 RepID=A0A2V5KDJ6_9BACL|nr:AraC family transcriptional regulator [Paenibacillus flagellatus]PYI56274.1 hypothetical protein DLM86_04630 [Paenibacillus flagellatus]
MVESGFAFGPGAGPAGGDLDSASAPDAAPKRRRPSQAVSIASAADYIRERPGAEISIRQLAGMAGLSESTFRRLFHETYGVSPKQFAQRCRLAEAQWLLRASAKPVRYVAEQTGFQSIHAFSAWFQRTVGLTPSEWRKRQGGGMGGFGTDGLGGSDVKGEADGTEGRGGEV